jgi:hypothetical protein
LRLDSRGEGGCRGCFPGGRNRQIHALDSKEKCIPLLPFPWRPLGEEKRERGGKKRIVPRPVNGSHEHRPPLSQGGKPPLPAREETLLAVEDAEEAKEIADRV